MSITDLEYTGEANYNNPSITNDKQNQNKTDVSFDDVVNKFKQNLGLISMLPTLERVRGSLNSSNKEQVSIILGKIYNTDDLDKVNHYVLELESLLSNKESKTEAVKKESADTRNTEKKSFDILGTAKNLIFGSESLQKIKDIKIDGVVENIDEFNQRLAKLKSLLETIPEFQNLSINDKAIVLDNIDQLSNGLKEKGKIQLEFLNNKFDDLTKQIDKEGNGQVSLNFGNGNFVNFDSKEQAYDFISELKKNAEFEMQDIGKTYSEIAGKGLVSLLSIGLSPLLIPYRILKSETIDDMEENIRNDAEWYTWTGDSITGILVILGAINYTETLRRRLIIDNLAKMGLKNHPFLSVDVTEKDSTGKDIKVKKKKAIRIDDYSLNKSYFGEAKAAELRDEYLQRVTALNKLEDKLKTISDPNHQKAFEKELNNTKKYLNVNTDTFWLKALTLEKDNWFPKRLLNAFINSPSGWPTGFTLRDEATRYFNLDAGNNKEDLNKGHKFVFSDGGIDVDNDGKIKINGGTNQSDNIASIKNYVLSRTTLSVPDNQRITQAKADDILKRIDDFTKSLLVTPKSEESIKRELIYLSREDYLSKGDILSKIDDKIKSKYPFLGNNSLTWKQEVDNFIINKVKKGYGNIAPASFTSGDSMLFKFREIVNSGGWIGDSDDLDKIFTKVDSGKLEIKDIFFKGKISFISNFISGFYDRYGLSTPEVTELKSFGKDVKSSEIKDILDKGKEYTKKINEGKSIIKGSIGDNLKHIFDLNTAKFPPDKEKIFEGIFDKMKEKVESGKIKLTGDEAKLELAKMYDGILPNFVILDIIKEGEKYGINIPNIGNKKSNNVKSFLTLVETGKWHGTIDDLNRVIVLLNGNRDISDKLYGKDVDSILSKIDIEGKRLHEISFKNIKYGIFFEDSGNIKFDTKGFENNELELSKLYHGLDGNILDSKLGDLLQNINQKKIDYTSEEFFNELKKALNLGISVDIDTTRAKFKESIIDENILKIDKRFENFDTKTLDEKEKIITDLKKLLGISSTNKESSITKVMGSKVLKIIDDIIKAEKDFEVERKKVDDENLKNENIDKEKKALKRKIDEIQHRNNLDSLEKLKDDFGKLIENSNINEVELDLIKTEFYDKCKLKEDIFNSNGSNNQTHNTQSQNPGNGSTGPDVAEQEQLRQAELIKKSDSIIDALELQKYLDNPDQLFDVSILKREYEKKIINGVINSDLDILSDIKVHHGYDSLISIEKLNKLIDTMIRDSSIDYRNNKTTFDLIRKGDFSGIKTSRPNKQVIELILDAVKKGKI